MSPEQALRDGQRLLSSTSVENSRRVAELLLMHVLRCEKAGLVAVDALTARQKQAFLGLVERARHEPVHRVIGYREFHGLRFYLNESTLEPRDDSEALIDLTLDHLSDRQTRRLKICDLGTGTGAIGLALLSELPEAWVTLTDVSEKALEAAKKNAGENGFQNRCEFLQSNWFSNLDQGFDVIVSNPPYIETSEIEALDDNVKNHDPVVALDGGTDGLTAYRSILAGAKKHLKDEGFVTFEIGHQQAASLEVLCHESGWQLKEVRQDLSGKDRAVLIVPDDKM